MRYRVRVSMCFGKAIEQCGDRELCAPDHGGLPAPAPAAGTAGDADPAHLPEQVFSRPPDPVPLPSAERGNGDWRDAVADTTIPWAIDWLACYEGWLATGEWAGGGVHPTKERAA